MRIRFWRCPRAVEGPLLIACGVTVGDTIRLFGGSGGEALTLHVSAVLARKRLGTMSWAKLRGREVRPDGTLDPRERVVFVRLDRARRVTT